ncbi:MAG: M48 family metalloprotease [Chromatiales bacterium]|jgi:beta-barrel assembly-enhancing protease|nr:M48 family metalloprotease [Chromatiales bacterium]
MRLSPAATAVLLLGIPLAILLGGCQTTTDTASGPVIATEASNTLDGTEGMPLEDIKSLKPGARPPVTSVEAGWWMKLDNMEQKARTAGNRVRDPTLNKYVEQIVCRVAGAFCKDIRVYLVQVPHFNASMAPNGMMQVWTGLILRARNEAQLAAVIGHEIGHYLRRHTLQRMRSVSNTADFMIFFQIGLAAAGVPVAGDVAQLIAMGALQAYGRDHEREADRIGLELMTKAGYDPREASKVWAQIIAERDAQKDAPSASIFFASHPPSEERRETLAKLAENRIGNVPSGEIGRERFLSKIGAFRERLLRDEMHVRKFDRAIFLIDSLINDGHRVGELHYYKGEIHRLRNDSEENDLEAAVTAYKNAVASDDAPPIIYRSLGLVYGRQNKPDKSREAYRKYLELVPNAVDREFIRRLIARTS